ASHGDDDTRLRIKVAFAELGGHLTARRRLAGRGELAGAAKPTLLKRGGRGRKHKAPLLKQPNGRATGDQLFISRDPCHLAWERNERASPLARQGRLQLRDPLSAHSVAQARARAFLVPLPQERPFRSRQRS